jgi:putative oxidoreductase
MFQRLLATEDDSAALVLRVMLGVVFFPHGAQKVLGLFGGHGFTGTVLFFTETMRIPYALVLLVMAAEFLGAIGLIVGLMTRVAAFGIFCVMAGAVYMVHLPNGFFMNWSGNQAGEGFEYHLLVMAIAVALMIRGGGRWSLDRLLSRG